MDKEFIYMLLKIIVLLPFIIMLIYFSFKYGGKKLETIQNGRYFKVLERITISKDNYLLVVKMGEKAYIMCSTAKSIEILKEITEDELDMIEKSKEIQEFKSVKELLKKLKEKKEDKNG